MWPVCIWNLNGFEAVAVLGPSRTFAKDAGVTKRIRGAAGKSEKKKARRKKGKDL